MDTQNSSMGLHTFSFFQRLTARDSYDLGGCFIKYMNETGVMKRQPIENGWQYSYNRPNVKGIRWRLVSRKINDSLTIHGLYVIITPKVLIGKDYISAATEADLEETERLFNEEAARISPIIKSFGACSVSRGDPCVNFDFTKLRIPCTSNQMFKLIKRGDMPNRHFSERTEWSDNSRKQITSKKNLYLDAKSVTINCYPKDDYADDVLRFEVQCGYQKLRSLIAGSRHKSKYYKSPGEIPEDEFWEIISEYYTFPNPSYSMEEKPIFILNPSNPVDLLLSDTVYAGVIRKYWGKVIRQGDYLTLDGARWMVEAHNFQQRKKERLIWTLELINECRGIAKAKSKLQTVDMSDFKRSLDDLDVILVNPVTVPREWKIEHIPNLLRAYYNSVTEEQVIPYNERLFEKLLAEYLS